MPTATPRPASPRQVLLGLFVLGQLAFLFLSNSLGFVQWFTTEHSSQWGPVVERVAPQFAEQKGHGWQWGEELEQVMRRWTQLTLQDQSWSLFAPDPGKDTGFPGVLLLPDDEMPSWLHLFDEEAGHHVLGNCGPSESTYVPQALLTATAHLRDLAGDSPLSCLAWQSTRLLAAKTEPAYVLLSENEPEDIREFFRVGRFRLRRYEGMVYVSTPLRKVKTPGKVPEERLETPEESADRLTRRMRYVAREYRDGALAYMKSRLGAWRRAHPEAPQPGQVILFQRSYRIHDVDEPYGWDGPFVVPILRWRPRAGQADKDIVLESYDFTEHRFVPVY